LQQLDLTIPATVNLTEVVPVIDHCIAQVGLTITRKEPLATYPGSIHWHLKEGKARGVLELTLWPAERRFWVSIHSNCSAPWIKATQPVLQQLIEQAL
jgi:hypothetical protein